MVTISQLRTLFNQYTQRVAKTGVKISVKYVSSGRYFKEKTCLEAKQEHASKYFRKYRFIQKSFSNESSRI